MYCRASNVSGERSPFDGSCCGSGYHTVDSTPLGSPEEREIPKYRVVLLGDSGVGKTALVSQFMTSEYMNTYDASLGEIITFIYRINHIRTLVSTCLSLPLLLLQMMSLERKQLVFYLTEKNLK